MEYKNDQAPKAQHNPVHHGMQKNTAGCCTSKDDNKRHATTPSKYPDQEAGECREKTDNHDANKKFPKKHA